MLHGKFNYTFKSFWTACSLSNKRIINPLHSLFNLSWWFFIECDSRRKIAFSVGVRYTPPPPNLLPDVNKLCVEMFSTFLRGKQNFCNILFSNKRSTVLRNFSVQSFSSSFLIKLFRFFLWISWWFDTFSFIYVFDPLIRFYLLQTHLDDFSFFFYMSLFIANALFDYHVSQLWRHNRRKRCWKSSPEEARGTDED